MLPTRGQSSKSTENTAQLWLAAAACESNAAEIGASRVAKRKLERAASLAMLADTGAPEMPRRSLAHSGGCAAIAIAPAGCVAGIDIEVTTARDVHSLAQFAFASDEARQLRLLAGPAATARFYVLWTLKEAFAKALGMPLLAALRGCSFARHDGCWTARIPTAAPWRAIVFAPRPALTLAAAIVGPRQASCNDWTCREWPGAATTSWRCLATLTGDAD